MINAIIIDDEKHAQIALKNKLLQYCPEVHLQKIVSSAQEAFTDILNFKPDLIFLDIAMPEMSGFDLLDKFKKIDFEIIFVTGFDSYAIDAIQFCAIGYLLKPVEGVKLIKAVDNALLRVNEKNRNIGVEELLVNLKTPSSKKNKIGIPTIDGLEFVAIENIVRCEGMQKLTKIVRLEDNDIISSYNIGEFIKLLSTYNFFTSHKSHLINFDHIKQYHREGTVTMIDNSIVPISKRKKKKFLNSLTRL